MWKANQNAEVYNKDEKTYHAMSVTHNANN